MAFDGISTFVQNYSHHRRGLCDPDARLEFATARARTSPVIQGAVQPAPEWGADAWQSVGEIHIKAAMN